MILQKNMTKRRILGIAGRDCWEAPHDMWLFPAFTTASPRTSAANFRAGSVCGDIQRSNKELIPINLFMFRKSCSASQSRSARRCRMSLFRLSHLLRLGPESFCEAFRVPPEKLTMGGLHHGHLQETDMVVGYVDAIDAGRIKDGDLVMLATNGAGFSWGASLVQH